MDNVTFWIIFIALHVGGLAALVYIAYEITYPIYKWFTATRMKK